MPDRVVLRFQRSTSQNMSKAIRRLRKLGVFNEPEAPDGYYQAELTLQQLSHRLSDFDRLWEIVQNWRSSEILLDGEVIRRADLDGYLQAVRCHSRRQESVRPDKYCWLTSEVEGWGCKHLRSVSSSSQRRDRWQTDTDFSYWYEFGRFSEDGKWIIDKPAIVSTLVREGEIRKLTLCPIFSEEGLRERVEQLPDHIPVGDESEWKIRYSDNDAGGLVEKKAIGVTPKDDEEDELTAELSRAFRMGASGTYDQPLGASRDVPRNRQVPDVSFDDIGGIETQIQTIREVIELPIKRPEIFVSLGIKPHKGIILYGPPGCGKTLVAKAVANEIDAHFTSIGGPELLNKYIGQSEENLRRVFQEAASLAPSVIFFDEIDAIAQIRSGEDNNRHQAQFVNQFLTLMDGMHEYERVCVLASTNRLELIDPAMLSGNYAPNLPVVTI